MYHKKFKPYIIWFRGCLWILIIHMSSYRVHINLAYCVFCWMIQNNTCRTGIMYDIINDIILYTNNDKLILVNLTRISLSLFVYRVLCIIEKLYLILFGSCCRKKHMTRIICFRIKVFDKGSVPFDPTCTIL